MSVLSSAASSSVKRTPLQEACVHMEEIREQTNFLEKNSLRYIGQAISILESARANIKTLGTTIYTLTTEARILSDFESLNKQLQEQMDRIGKACESSNAFFHVPYHSVMKPSNAFEAAVGGGKKNDECKTAFSNLHGDEAAQAVDLVYLALESADRPVSRKDFVAEHAQAVIEHASVDFLNKIANLFKAQRMIGQFSGYINKLGIEDVSPGDLERRVGKAKVQYFDFLSTGVAEANREAGRLAQMRLLEGCYVMRGGTSKLTFAGTIGSFDAVTEVADRLAANGLKLLKTKTDTDALAAFVRKLNPASEDVDEGGATARSATSGECRIQIAVLKRDFPDVYAALMTGVSSAAGKHGPMAGEIFIAQMSSSVDVAMVVSCARLILDFDAGLSVFGIS